MFSHTRLLCAGYILVLSPYATAYPSDSVQLSLNVMGLNNMRLISAEVSSLRQLRLILAL